MRGGANRISVGFVLATMISVTYAAPHRLRVYPNAALRAFAIAQGPDEFLWLAASDGLYRFDGFHYHKITAFPLASQSIDFQERYSSELPCPE